MARPSETYSTVSGAGIAWFRGPELAGGPPVTGGIVKAGHTVGRDRFVKKKLLRFGRGFRVVLGNPRSQAAEMVLPPGKAEGDRDNRHRGADPWLFVESGSGVATVNKSLRTLNFHVPPTYDSQGDELPRGKR